MNKFFFIICFLFFGKIYGQVSPTNSLYLYYPLDGNAIDYGNEEHNGTVFGAQPTTDRFGNLSSALAFNGTNNLHTFKYVIPAQPTFLNRFLCCI